MRTIEEIMDDMIRNPPKTRTTSGYMREAMRRQAEDIFKELEEYLMPCCGIGEYCDEGIEKEDRTNDSYNPPMNKYCDSIHRRELEDIKNKWCKK